MRPRRQNSHNSKGLCRALDHVDADVINIVKTSFQQNVTDNHQEANINYKILVEFSNFGIKSSLANKNEKKRFDKNSNLVLSYVWFVRSAIA